MHTHDWATAPVAFAGDLAGAKSVFTIHNLNYGADLIGRAMAASAACTTVSPTYAAEVGIALILGFFFRVLGAPWPPPRRAPPWSPPMRPRPTLFGQRKDAHKGFVLHHHCVFLGNTAFIRLERVQQRSCGGADTTKEMWRIWGHQ